MTSTTRLRSSLAVSSLVALVAVVGCRSGSDDPQQGDPTKAGPIAVEAYCDALAREQCAIETRCCGQAGLGTDAAECRTIVRASCDAAVAKHQAAGHAFQPANAGICVASKQALFDGCAARKEDPPPADPAASIRARAGEACSRVWAGTVPPGGDCKTSDDCAPLEVPGSKPVCASTTTGAGTTHACKHFYALGEGAVCSALDCRQGLRCNNEPGKSGTCVADSSSTAGRAKLGASCGFDVLCDEGLACDAGTCAPAHDVGGSCLWAGDCKTELFCEAKTCQAKRAIGEACKDGSGCASGTCLDAKCIATNHVASKAVCNAIKASPADAPLDAPPAPAPRTLAVGEHHACALVGAGQVKCWGDNASGQLGSSGTGATPKLVSGVDKVVEVAAGADHTCARRADGSVWCWGGNQYGQLGAPPGSCAKDACVTPARVSLPVGAVKLALGRTRTCALGSDGRVFCFGLQTLNGATPAPLPGVDNAQDLGLEGNGSICAIVGPGRYLKCWSTLEDAPRIEIGTTGDPMSSVSKFVGGYNHKMALLADGSLRLWGFADQLVTGAKAIAGATDVAGGDRFACAVVADGSVSCWGANFHGELGGGTSGADRSAPSKVINVVGATEVAANRQFACARTASGAVWCWGENFNGTVPGGTFSRPGPVLVAL